MFRRKISVVFFTVMIGAVECAGAPVEPDRVKELERLVLQDCGSCHGGTLKGGLGPDLQATALAGRSAQSLATVILNGVPGTAMPPWRTLLTENEAQWIADYLLNGGRQ